LLLGLPGWVTLGADGAQLWVFNAARGAMQRVGFRSTPLLAPGPGPLPAEMVVLPGDPPDPVTFGGDYVWLRRHAPNFTLAPDGDLTMVEGVS
jgi:hypothetical protein